MRWALLALLAVLASACSSKSPPPAGSAAGRAACTAALGTLGKPVGRPQTLVAEALAASCANDAWTQAAAACLEHRGLDQVAPIQTCLAQTDAKLDKAVADRLGRAVEQLAK